MTPHPVTTSRWRVSLPPNLQEQHAPTFPSKNRASPTAGSRPEGGCHTTSRGSPHPPHDMPWWWMSNFFQLYITPHGISGLWVSEEYRSCKSVYLMGQSGKTPVESAGMKAPPPFPYCAFFSKQGVSALRRSIDRTVTLCCRAIPARTELFTPVEIV